MTHTTTLNNARQGVSLPRLLLHLEGFTLFLAAVGVYAAQHYDGLLFALLIFAPDLAALGYLVNTRLGSQIYNAAHTTIVPVTLLALGLLVPDAAGIIPVALIWLAHIGADRALGYGLKYPTVFKDTHLNRV